MFRPKLLSLPFKEKSFYPCLSSYIGWNKCNSNFPGSFFVNSHLCTWL